NSPFDEEHFEGVEFSYGYPPKDEDAIVVSEAVCSRQHKGDIFIFPALIL
ncbi:TPA: hypothetical protein SL203_005985, partial [Pseudomonas aeruginosa]|nr:hypothetical protein [Pseudomonas aeruginosa]